MRQLRVLAASMLLVSTMATGCVPPPAGRATATPPPSASSSMSPTASPVPTGPTPFPSFVRPTPTALPTFLAYVVQSGDTLTAIARRFATTPLSIAYWNRATYTSLDPESEGYQPNRIKVGWTLVVIPGAVLDPSDLAEPSPSIGPSGSPETSEAPDTSAPPSDDASDPPATASPVAGGPATIARHGPRDSRAVALTFDMGGRLDPAVDILEWLVAQRVPATIFPTGHTGTETAQGQAALDIVALHSDLFDVGNHSWSHPDFRDLDDAAMRDQLTRTETAVVAATGRSTKPWFRPPFGGLDDQMPAVVGGAGWSTIVLWDIDTIDWRPESDGGPTTADIVTKVVDRAQAGSIVLMHLGGYHTREALPSIVGGLRAKGLRLVTLGEMFGA